MARNGAGTYQRVAGTPYVYDTVIDEVVVNSEFDDIATALTQSLAKDGQTVPTANIPMGGYKITNLGNATVSTDALALGQMTASTGASLVGAANPLVAIPYLQTLSDIANGEMISVLRFIDSTKHAGIRARTNTDDFSTQFNDAFAATDSLYVPWGTYHWEAMVKKIGLGGQIRGHGMAATKINLVGAIVGLLLGNDTGDSETNHEMALSDLWIDGGTYALRLGSTVSPKAFLGSVARVKLTGSTEAKLDLVASQGAHLYDMFISGTAGDGIAARAVSGYANTATKLTRVRLYQNDRGAYIENIQGLTFDNCNIESNQRQGILMQKVDGYTLANINVINGCWFESNLADGTTTGTGQIAALAPSVGSSYVSYVNIHDNVFNGVTTPASNIHIRLHADVLGFGGNYYVTPASAVKTVTLANASGYDRDGGSSLWSDPKNVIIDGQNTAGHYLWDTTNPSDLVGTQTNAANTGTFTADSLLYTASNSSGTVTFTFKRAGKYMVVFGASTVHAASYTQARVKWSFGGTATRYGARTTYANSEEQDTDADMSFESSMLISATANQTVTILPTYELSGAGVVGNHNFAPVAMLQYVGG
jgi:hypothetical protein